jgi:vacuolar-type H+-ATPase subunit E/Vma4
MSEPLEALLARVTAEAEAQRTALLAEARAEAERVMQDMEAAAAAARDTALRRRMAAEQAETARSLEEIRRAARRDRLEVEHAAVERILTLLAARLPAALADPRYPAAARAELREALAVLEGQPARVRATPDLCEWARAQVGPEVPVVPDPAVLGFVLEAADDRVRVDGSLAVRFQALRPRLAMAAARMLAEPS